MTKRNKIIYWIATAWLSLGMLSTAAVQLLKIKTGSGGVDSIVSLGYPVYFVTILGIWKIMGVIVVLLPGFPLLKEWAYAGFFFAMSGAVFSHVASGDGAAAVFGPTLLLVLTVISWYLRPDGKFISVKLPNEKYETGVVAQPR